MIKKNISNPLRDCLFLINFNPVFFLHSLFFWSVLISNSDLQRKTWVNSLRCPILRCMSIWVSWHMSSFSLWSESHCYPIQWLSLIYPFSFLSLTSSVEGFASWSDMATVASSKVSSQQQPCSRIYKPMSLPHSTTTWLPVSFFKCGFSNSQLKKCQVKA